MSKFLPAFCASLSLLKVGSEVAKIEDEKKSACSASPKVLNLCLIALAWDSTRSRIPLTPLSQSGCSLLATRTEKGVPRAATHTATSAWHSSRSGPRSGASTSSFEPMFRASATKHCVDGDAAAHAFGKYLPLPGPSKDTQ